MAEEPMSITLPALGVIVPLAAQKWVDAGFRVSFAVTDSTIALMMTNNGLVEYIVPAAVAPAPGPPAPAAATAQLQGGLSEAETCDPPLDAHVPHTATASSPEASPATSHHPVSLSSLSSSPHSAGEAAGDKLGDGGAPFNPEATSWAAAWQPQQQQQHHQLFDFTSPASVAAAPSHFFGPRLGTFSDVPPAQPSPAPPFFSHAPPMMGLDTSSFPLPGNRYVHAFNDNTAATYAVQAAEQQRYYPGGAPADAVHQMPKDE